MRTRARRRGWHSVCLTVKILLVNISMFSIHGNQGSWKLEICRFSSTDIASFKKIVLIVLTTHSSSPPLWHRLGSDGASQHLINWLVVVSIYTLAGGSVTQRFFVLQLLTCIMDFQDNLPIRLCIHRLVISTSLMSTAFDLWKLVSECMCFWYNT